MFPATQRRSSALCYMARDEKERTLLLRALLLELSCRVQEPEHSARCVADCTGNRKQPGGGKVIGREQLSALGAEERVLPIAPARSCL